MATPADFIDASHSRSERRHRYRYLQRRHVGLTEVSWIIPPEVKDNGSDSCRGNRKDAETIGSFELLQQPRNGIWRWTVVRLIYVAFQE